MYVTLLFVTVLCYYEYWNMATMNVYHIICHCAVLL